MSMNNHFPKHKSNRIVLFADLRDSTDILINFEQGLYQDFGADGRQEMSYDQFIRDVHETTHKLLYLGHEYTYAEVYGDGVMGVFPDDNTKYILENIYHLTSRMRAYNDTVGVGVSRPRIDMGIGITIGEVSFVYYPFDDRDHAVGQSIHEAARIEGLTRLYDARLLISHRFLKFAEPYLHADSRFSHRFIDQVVLRGFREPITLIELLLDNDPRFDLKERSNAAYCDAYADYCVRQWKSAKIKFQRIYKEYGLGIGAVMADRCDWLAGHPPSEEWNGIWNMKDK